MSKIIPINLAQKLKEKGFLYLTEYYYSSLGQQIPKYHPGEFINHNTLSGSEIAAPEVDEVIEDLYKNDHLYISYRPYREDHKTYWKSTIYLIGQFISEYEGISSETQEDCTLETIDYILDNYI